MELKVLNADIGKSDYYTGTLPEGCQQCVLGKKLVLFITGMCSRQCFYCPVGDHKFGSDVIFANERPVQDISDVFLEVNACGATGAGITGGDPLCRVERCAAYITALKQKYGSAFHIHLYTPLELVNAHTMHLLYTAGLDELRLHFDLDTDQYWDHVHAALAFDWTVGVEIPAIPTHEKETKKLIYFLAGKVSFLNLNELEVADTKLNVLLDRGYVTKDTYSYGVLGSSAFALEMVRYASAKGLTAHHCTAATKDGIQLMERVKNRGKIVAHSFDIQTPDATFIRGVIYEEKPSFGYRAQLALKHKDVEVRRLRTLRTHLCQTLRLNKADVAIDDVKYRLLTSRKIVVKYQQEIRALCLIPAIVEEMPTYDLFEVEIEFLE